jgi:8-oxo-dGTP pyrophosphatase MutT (NUDIX family)
MSPFMRHIAACNTADLPGGRLALRLGDAPVGWVSPAVAASMARLPRVRVSGDAVSLELAADLPGIARALSDGGAFIWRNEPFDVRATPDGPALGQVDRGALPLLGITAIGVHVNGLVRTPDGLHLWVAVRSASKHLDPGKLDHIVAGGVAAGMTPAQTLVKEAAEEATIPPALAAAAVPVGRIGYAMKRQEGLRRDLQHCYDLHLPVGFIPRPADDEVDRFELWPVTRAFEQVRDGDAFKFNVNLVLIDLFVRLGMIESGQVAELRAGLSRLL